MLQSITLFTGLGLLLGLVAFLLLFRKWDLPAYLKQNMKINTRVKAVIFVLLLSFVLALMVSLLVKWLHLNETAGQLLEGVAIGLNCAILAELYRAMLPKNRAASQVGKGATGKNKPTQTGGRRGKG
ncbi:MAG: hypothetical protein LBS18_03640 [Clostridiales bacterium]|jgi:dipeptide/tripeptide permease|nr:hypothetical protein [Clostridiales bacterium]